jgi:phage terminase large subunit-like protein
MLYRLLTTKGILSTTFTPLLGMSEVVSSFLECTRRSKNRPVDAAEAASTPEQN